MTEKELDYLADKIATQIIDKLFDAGDLQISYFPPATDEEVMVAELARLMTLMSTYEDKEEYEKACLLYTSPSPRDRQKSRMPSSA